MSILNLAMLEIAAMKHAIHNHNGNNLLLQVAERTAADKKGGHLCRRLSDGRFMLRESAMCPDDDKASFEDISKHKFFNTNNLWVNLPKLKVNLNSCMQAMPAVLHPRSTLRHLSPEDIRCARYKRGKHIYLGSSSLE